jgi:hypothetical protein
LRFLKRKPLPAKLVGESHDGDDVTVALTGDSSSAFSDAVTALDNCWTIRALDKDGNTIRKLEMDPQDPELAADAPDQSSSMAARSNTIISIDVPKLVDNIARNMREVAAAAASQQSKAFSEGFQAMTSVVNLCLQMLVRVERRLEVAEERTELAAPADGNRNQLVMLALQKALGGETTTQPQAGSNGGIHITPAMINSLLEQFMASGATSEGDGSNGAG